MTLRYEWSDTRVNVPHGNHTEREEQEIDYSYDREIKVGDLVAYLTPMEIKGKKDLENERKCAYYYMARAISYLKDMGFVELEDLENDEDFYEFMKDRYESEARKSFNEENGRY